MEVVRMIVRDLPLLGAPVNIGRPVLWFTVSRLVAKTLGAALPGQELNVSLTLTSRIFDSTPLFSAGEGARSFPFCKENSGDQGGGEVSGIRLVVDVL
jgi:hypothetical protein